MKPITIPSEDSMAFNDLKDGNSAQVRVVVREDEQQEYKKGSVVQVKHDADELKGKIVSDPLVIDDKRDDGCTLVSLVVEKA